MNSRQKGNAAELSAVKILEKQGYLVIRSPRTMKMIGPGKFMSMANDYYELYDLIARYSRKVCATSDKEWTRKHTKLIQVKSTQSGVSSVKKPIAEFHDRYCNEHEISEIWMKVARKGFVIHTYCNKESGWYKVFINLKGEVVEKYKISKN